MKNVYSLIFACLLMSCAGKKPADGVIPDNYAVETICATDGDCTFTIIKNKSLVCKGTGTARYYQLITAPGSVVIKYTYTKKTNPAYADGNYSEEFLFETDESFANLKGQKGSNPTINRIFGIHCFCRGKAGYYNAGNAIIKYHNNTLTFTIPPVAEGQVIDTVKVVFRQ